MKQGNRKSSQRSAGGKRSAKSASAKAAVENMPEITPETLASMIAERAYFKAEQRGFQDGSPEQDWYEAEAEIDGKFHTPGARTKKVRNSAQGERRRRRHNYKAL